MPFLLQVQSKLDWKIRLLLASVTVSPTICLMEMLNG